MDDRYKKILDRIIIEVDDGIREYSDILQNGEHDPKWCAYMEVKAIIDDAINSIAN